MSYSIEVSNVSKKFRNYIDKQNTLKDKVLRFGKQTVKEDWILEEINLMINEGHTVGLVGRNGSGKSTLLKLMTKILHPDVGSIKTNGRVSSLLELGAGFHPEFTGIENIYMNASILGLSKKEIDAKLNEIIAFSELHEYIHQPVRIYSSGMYMRLAFSVAISVDPDILLIDEVLAVGDSAFQNKCLEKIKELKGKGKTIVVVTHDNSMVEKICDRAVWINNGKVRADGSPRDIIMQYMAFLSEEENKRLIEDQKLENNEIPLNESLELSNITEPEENRNHIRVGNKKIEIQDVWFSDSQEQIKRNFNTGDQMIINIQYKINEKASSVVFGVGFFTSDNTYCYGTNTNIDRSIPPESLPNEGHIRFNISKLTLLPGIYKLDVAVHHENGEPYDYLTSVYSFQVSSDINDVGIVRLDHTWELKG
ncbi:ABC transporter ATP-binding protein [Paenibacillus sp. 453mf]|uniref:ABC transporter ATP-binding protein n=1 Tax=Paenibacillus sp. 453mf TaxID=1761874 RepID=UPI0008E680D3|nr:ABC transporter ATP-binding protein [Paenibacillus sp. 453mf]SFS84576.1 ABC-2 type transport system ATP-binding protein [Paenibacillus sp. 453mf]